MNADEITAENTLVQLGRTRLVMASSTLYKALQDAALAADAGARAVGGRGRVLERQLIDGLGVDADRGPPPVGDRRERRDDVQGRDLGDPHRVRALVVGHDEPAAVM